MSKNTRRYIWSSNKIRIGKNVYARILRTKKERSELAIIIDEETSAQQLRETWSQIDMIRYQLIQREGTNFDKVHNLLRLRKAARHLSGLSYSEIAMETNYDSLVNLCRASIEMEMGDMKAAKDSLSHSQVHLFALRMKEQEVAEWTWHGLATIKEGMAPWTVTRGPVDKDRVRANCRQVDRELKSSKIIIKSIPESRTLKLSELELNPIDDKARELAKQLLRQEPEMGGLPRLLEALTRHLVSTGDEGVEKTG